MKKKPAENVMKQVNARMLPWILHDGVVHNSELDNTLSLPRGINNVAIGIGSLRSQYSNIADNDHSLLGKIMEALTLQSSEDDG